MGAVLVVVSGQFAVAGHGGWGKHPKLRYTKGIVEDEPRGELRIGSRYQERSGPIESMNGIKAHGEKARRARRGGM